MKIGFVHMGQPQTDRTQARLRCVKPCASGCCWPTLGRAPPAQHAPGHAPTNDAPGLARGARPVGRNLIQRKRGSTLATDDGPLYAVVWPSGLHASAWRRTLESNPSPDHHEAASQVGDLNGSGAPTDILAHGLWAGIGVAVAARHWHIPRRTALATIGLAMAPDVLQLLPLIGFALLEQGHWSLLWAYASALPGMEPAVPPMVALLVHHLHCIPHSAVIAAIVTLSSLALTRAVWLPLWGWWSHIVIDTFTHSADFYPVPVFYPFTQWGFDGLAWNTPWFQLANYGVMVWVGGWLLWRRRLERD
jgi:hypothetical protein